MAEAAIYPDSDFSDEDETPLDKSFNKASDHVRKLTSTLDSDKLLGLYGLYKQGIDGNCNTPKPRWYDVKGCKKWEAWRALMDTPQDIAKEKYIQLVQIYDPDWNCITKTKEGSKDTWVTVSSLWHSDDPKLDRDQLSLLEAAREGYGDRVAELLSSNPELKNEKDEDGLTALHWAADRGATSALAAAISGGCPIDAVDDSGQTALHYAASCGHLTSAQLLLDSGASVLKDSDGATPVDVAADDEIKNLILTFES